MAFPKLLDGARVLSVDPSICNCGWAVMANANGEPRRVDSGVWHPSAAKDAIGRWGQLFEFLEGLAASVDYAVIEEPNRGRIARQAKFSREAQITYGRAVGTVEAAVRSNLANDRVFVPDVSAWKGKGKKGATLDDVSLRLAYRPRDDNEADALGIALWFMNRCLSQI